MFHSARWDGGADLAGKHVGVVGTGASAAQIVPALAGRAAGLVVFQRTPPWVVPRGDRAYTAQERRGFALDPGAERALRDELFDEAERAIDARRRVRPDIDRLRDRALDHLAAQVPDAELRARLTPDYEIGCKRIVISDDLYPALGRDDVTLEPSALARVEKATAIAASGAHHRVDALVLATGFWTTRLPFAQRIEGRHGLLAQRWADGMTAHASTAVHGFPNMFVINGPNASLGHNSAVYMIETQIDHVLGALDHLRTRPGTSLEVTRRGRGGLHPRDRRDERGHGLAAGRVRQLVRRRDQRAADPPLAGHRAVVPRAQRDVRPGAVRRRRTCVNGA